MTVLEYCRKLSTLQLQALLREACEGRGNLTEVGILDICPILSERDPNLPTVKQIRLNLFRIYVDA